MAFLPGWLNLDSLSIIRLAALLLSLVICLHLLRVPRTSASTLFLAGVFAGALLFNIASFFEFAGPWYWQPRSPRTVLVTLAICLGPSVSMVCLILFAYHFPRFRRAERREFRIVFALALALNAGVLCLNVYDHFVLQWQRSDTRLWDTYWTVFYCSLAVQFGGAIAILFRKAALLSGHASATLLHRLLHPLGHDARAARALGASLLLPLLAVSASLAMTYSVLPFSLATYLTWLGLLLFYVVFVATYLAYSADPLTLQLKMVGATLVVIVSTMGLVALFVGETAASAYRPPPLPPEGSTVCLTPNRMHSYDIAQAPDSFDPDLGERVAFVYGRPFPAALAFDFPFFEERYRTIHVLNGPMIYLGSRFSENGWGGYNPQPAIAPLVMNLDPSRGGGIHLKSSPASMTITWFRLPELGADNVNTIQLVLRPDGTIAMRFKAVSTASKPSLEQLYNYTAASTTGGDPAPGGKPAPFPPRLTGIHPGGFSAPLQQISFTTGLPWSGRGRAVIFESHEAAFSGYLSSRIGVLAVLTVAASLLVFLLIPLLLRASLFAPLRVLSGGMRQVQEGNLQTAVRVESRDEIGSLAKSFNRMVESLARAESSFRALAEDVPDGIIVFSGDSPGYANRRAVEMMGHSTTGLMQATFGSLFRSAELPRYGVQPDAPVEALALTASGAALPVELAYSRTLWHGMPAIAVLIRDISRRKTEEEAAARRQESMMRMDKLTSLGVLAASLAHEISVPNQVIQSNASVLSRGIPHLAAGRDLDGEGSEGLLIAGMDAAEFRARWPAMLSAIARSSALIDGIIRNLRDFSADAPDQQTTSFDINTAISRAVDLVAAYIRRATDRFSITLQPSLPRMRGNAQGLQQVFINLLLNSCQSLGDRNQAIAIRSCSCNCTGETKASLRVVVHDEGTGMTPDILSRVREPFFTTRRAAGGSGLGLYVTQAIVKAHGGTLELLSQAGIGTDAIVTFPAEAQP